MKYINKREDFLKKSKHDKIGKLIKEAAGGPFTNDIPWGDSLVGRLINAIVRKSGIAINVTRIKKLIPRLKELFDEILEDSKLSKESQVKVWKLKVFALLQKLKKAVDNEEEINVLVYITDDLITIVDSDYIDDENRKTLLDELKKFKEFLLSLKDESPEEEQEEEEEEKEEVKPVSKNTQEIPFDFCIKNLKAVYAILVAYKKAMTAKGEAYLAKKDSTGKEIKVGDEYTYNNIKVKVIDLRNPKNYGDDKKWLTDDDTLGTGTMADNNVYVVDISKDKPGNTGYPAIVNKLKPITESKQNGIFSAIAPVYNLFKNYPDVFKELESIFNPKQSTDLRNKYLQKHKSPLLKVYNTVRLNEGLTEVLTRPEDLGKALITMYKSTKVKEDGSFEGIQDDMKLAIVDFNKTMKVILQFQSGIVESPKDKEEVNTQDSDKNDFDFENKNRSNFSDSVRLLKYNSFMSINESEEQQPEFKEQQQESQQESKPESQLELDDTKKKISDFFNENCKEIIAFNVLTDEERSIIKKVNETKENKGIIMSMDPIIEIMKLFIKAYKTYTVQTITKRSENVDTNTLSEYTSFGGSGDTGRSGPYRNNKLFDMWEDAVNNIRKERKYQALFTANANLRLPVVTDPDTSKSSDWEIKPKAGLQFNRFINDILDGEKLYKAASERGKVSTFVDSYFGEGATKDQGTLETNDLRDAAKLESSKSKVELEFSKVVIKDEQLNINTLFTITYTNDKDQKRQRTFLITEIKNGYIYMSYALVKHYVKYLNKMNGSQKNVTKGTLPVNLSITDEASIKYTKIKQNEFNNIFRAGNTITINSVTNDGSTDSPVFSAISDVYWMVTKEDKKIYIIDNSTSPNITDVIKSFNDKNSTLQVESKSGIEIKKS